MGKLMCPEINTGEHSDLNSVTKSPCGCCCRRFFSRGSSSGEGGGGSVRRIVRGGGPDKKVGCDFSMTRHCHIVLDQYPSMLLLLEHKG